MKTCFKLAMLCLMVILYNCENDDLSQNAALNTMSGQKNVEEINLLNNYFDEYRESFKSDSIFLGLENSNIEIFKTLKRYYDKGDVSNDFLNGKVVSEDEFKNFEKQIFERTFWDIDLSKFNKVIYEKENTKKDKILYVAKPIFSLDKKYALIYSYRKNNEIYFIPSIEVYNKIKKKWKKVSTIKHF